MASTPGDWQRELSNYNRSFVSFISELLRIVVARSVTSSYHLRWITEMRVAHSNEQ